MSPDSRPDSEFYCHDEHHSADPDNRLAFDDDDAESLTSTIVSPLDATQSTITPESVPQQDLQAFQ